MLATNKETDVVTPVPKSVEVVAAEAVAVAMPIDIAGIKGIGRVGQGIA